MSESRIILAEDDIELRAWLRLVLRVLGATICEARNGAELRELLLAGRPFDLIISDIRMPLFSGLDVAQEARRRGMTTPILFLTGFGDAATEAAVAELGDAVLLRKPVEATVLLEQARLLMGAVVIIEPRD